MRGGTSFARRQHAPIASKRTVVPRSFAMNGTFSSTFRMMASSAPTYKNIIVDREGKVGLITLNRPEALNALNSALM